MSDDVPHFHPDDQSWDWQEKQRMKLPSDGRCVAPPKRQITVWIILLALSIVGCVPIKSKTDSLPPTKNVLCSGKIVYVASAGYASGRSYGRSDIFSINPDGSSVLSLTDNSGFDGYPTWSSDGQKIAFISTEDNKDNLYIMDHDGSNKIKLASLDGMKMYPSCSPNNRSIAFILLTAGPLKATKNEIKFFNLDTLQEDQLANLPKDSDVWPFGVKWSPDRRYLAIDGINFSNRSHHIYLIDIQRNTITNLTGDLNWAADPDWSPSGRKIVFISNESNGANEIYVMNIDGSNKIKIDIDLEGHKQRPIWSPDGERIAFFGFNRQLYTVKLDGSDLVKVVEIEDIIGDETQVKPTFDWQPVACPKRPR